MIDDALIDGILKIANHPSMKEDNVTRLYPLERYHVERTLRALDLFLQEYQKEKYGKDKET